MQNKARKAALAAVIAATGVVGVAPPASAAEKTVKMVVNGEVPAFKAPKSVKRGDKLTVVNKSDPEAIGPHTLSLVKPSELPSKKQWKKCGMPPFAFICATIFEAHEVEVPENGPPTVGKHDVEVGKKGWDKSFGKTGDSWLTENEGDKTSRRVTAKAGSALTLFCAVHPNMVAKVKVKK